MLIGLASQWRWQWTLLLCLLLSFSAHALLFFWLESSSYQWRIEGRELASIEVALQSGKTRNTDIQKSDELQRRSEVPENADEPNPSTGSKVPDNSQLKERQDISAIAKEESVPERKSVPEVSPQLLKKSLEIPVDSPGEAESRLLINSAAKADSIAISAPRINASQPTQEPLGQDFSPEMHTSPSVFSDVPGSEPIESESGDPVEAAASMTPSEPRYVMGTPQTPKPDYPHIARKRGWEGEVIIALTIADKGNVVAARIHQSSGYGVLDRKAMETLKLWRLAASSEESEQILVPVRFELR